MSMAARLFLIGIWNEADDYGLFAWKPAALKMRLAGNDNVDPVALLSEIEQAGFIVRFERDGKAFAAVKNFRVYQRPKNPSQPIVPLDDTLRSIVGLLEKPYPSSTPGVLQPDPSPPEISPQMEDGGDNRRMEDGDRKVESPPSQTSFARPPQPADISRGKRIDPAWEPGPEGLNYAEDQGLTPVEIRRESEAFRDYWLAKPGQDGRKSDWRATWRTWVRRVAERRTHPPVRAGPSVQTIPAGRPTSGALSAIAGMDAVLRKRSQTS